MVRGNGIAERLQNLYSFLFFIVPYMINIMNVWVINKQITIIEENSDLDTKLKAKVFGIEIKHMWLLSLLSFIIGLVFE